LEAQWLKTRVYEVMIASPGDVDKERRIISEAIHGWNHVHSKGPGNSSYARCLGHSLLASYGRPAQEISNKQALKDADLFIAVFWTKLGIPTGFQAAP
jgi:hypothetical protein